MTVVLGYKVLDLASRSILELVATNEVVGNAKLLGVAGAAVGVCAAIEALC